MRSRASFKGHPIHPGLIPFPFAFLTGGFLFDLAGAITGRSALWTTGAYVAAAGIVTALIAAVPGFIDYLYTVPPNSTGKRRATRHMLVNLAAVTLFAIAWWLRGGATAEPGMATLFLEAVGLGLLGAGGWMGGVLVSRNQISVDHRYAGAGKWRERRLEAGADGAVAIRSAGLEVNQMMLLHVDGRRIVLARTEDGYVAFDDHCTHRGGSLAGGSMICGTVQCPWHGSQFDVHAGTVRAGPAEQPIATYLVEEALDQVRVRVRAGERSGTS
jgi:nitrite reductase/ring-hydroxylating ferredoxin subunit/uncharacterized membrane protein